MKWYQKIIQLFILSTLPHLNVFFYSQYSSELFQITIDEVVNEVLERGPLNLTIFTRKTVERSHDLTAMKLHI